MGWRITLSLKPMSLLDYAAEPGPTREANRHATEHDLCQLIAVTEYGNSHAVFWSASVVYQVQDCSWLAEFIAGSPLLRRLEIHRSRVDDTRLMLLTNALANHPSLTDISLPYNVLGDDAARILARHLDHTGPRVRVVSLHLISLHHYWAWSTTGLTI